MNRSVIHSDTSALLWALTSADITSSPEAATLPVEANSVRSLALPVSVALLPPVSYILRSLTSNDAVSDALRPSVRSSCTASTVPSNTAAAPDSETDCNVL